MDIIDKLLAACVGYPVTNIPWPHRVLHDAADEIERLRAENQALREALECIAGGEIYPREVAREALAAKGE